VSCNPRAERTKRNPISPKRQPRPTKHNPTGYDVPVFTVLLFVVTTASAWWLLFLGVRHYHVYLAMGSELIVIDLLSIRVCEGR
jgi:hypothetical protein